MKHEFKDVQGKSISKIVFVQEAEAQELDVQFEDKTVLHIRLGLKMEIEAAELRDWSKGEGTLVNKFL